MALARELRDGLAALGFRRADAAGQPFVDRQRAPGQESGARTRGAGRRTACRSASARRARRFACRRRSSTRVTRSGVSSITRRASLDFRASMTAPNINRRISTAVVWSSLWCATALGQQPIVHPERLAGPWEVTGASGIDGVFLRLSTHARGTRRRTSRSSPANRSASACTIATRGDEILGRLLAVAIGGG